MILDNLPLINYGDHRLANIVKNWKVFIDGKLSIDAFYKYDLENGKSPQVLANEVYGDASYDTIIFIINNIVNPYNDWFKSPTEFKVYVDAKYGNKLHDVKWYKDLNTGFIKDDTFVYNGENEILPVTNFDYEVMKNDDKRVVTLLDKRYLNSFIKSIKERK